MKTFWRCNSLICLLNKPEARSSLSAGLELSFSSLLKLIVYVNFLIVWGANLPAATHPGTVEGSYARKRFMWRWRICAHVWSLGAKWRTWSWGDVNPSCTPGRRRVPWTSVGLWDWSQREIKQMFTAAAQMCSFVWPPQVCWAWPCFVSCSDWLTASWFKPASSRMSTGSLWRSPIGWSSNILFGRHPSLRGQWIRAHLFIHLLLFNILSNFAVFKVT